MYPQVESYCTKDGLYVPETDLDDEITGLEPESATLR